MRAIFISQEIKENEVKIIVRGDEAHHLINVIRVKIHDEVLLLNGRGLRIYSKVVLVTRKEVELELHDILTHKKKRTFDVGIGVIKKDAMSECLKICVEIGVNTVFPLKTKYSQREMIKEERINKLLESACIQTNAYYLPNVKEVSSLTKELIDQYDLVLICSAKNENDPDFKWLENDVYSNILLIVGPEGGLGVDEIEQLRQFKQCNVIHLNTNILRTPTALSVVSGWLLSKFYK